MYDVLSDCLNTSVQIAEISKTVLKLSEFRSHISSSKNNASFVARKLLNLMQEITSTSPGEIVLRLLNGESLRTEKGLTASGFVWALFCSPPESSSS